MGRETRLAMAFVYGGLVCVLLTATVKGDAVDDRLTNLGINVKGDVQNAIDAGAALDAAGLPVGLTVLIDQVDDESGNNPSPLGWAGDGEEPRLPKRPNGMNVWRTVMLYVPDTDPYDGEDDSFLYLGWDISDTDEEQPGEDLDTNPPRQFDSDNDGSAINIAAEVSGILETRNEFYSVILQSCADLGLFDPDNDPETNDIGTDNDIFIQFQMDILALQPTHIPVSVGFPDEILVFPREGLDHNGNNIDDYLDAEAEGNNVEMVLKRIDTALVGGRFAAARLVGMFEAGSSGEGNDEERAVNAVGTSIPEIEVTKEVRCVGEGDDDWRSEADAFSGSDGVEFRITIENTGNEDLELTVTDVLAAVGTQASLVTCEPVCETLTAFLTSPRRGLDEEPITPANANGYGLVGGFFADVCANLDLGFLGSIRNGESELLGTLLGAEVTRVAGECQEPEDGDTLVIKFEATVDVTDEEQFCAVLDDPDCQNAVTVTGTLVGESEVVAQDVAGDVVHDTANGVDTHRENAPGQGFDDNVVAVDLKCRDIDFSKTATAWNAAGALEPDSLPMLDLSDFPVFVQYRYRVVNNGELTETVSLTDKHLCNDVSALGGVSLDDCPVCDPGSVGDDLAGSGSGQLISDCIIKIDTPEAMLALMEQDDSGRPDCTTNDPVDEADPECYKNCANVSVTATDLPAGCNKTDTFGTDETICTGGECLIDVNKYVKCEEHPDPTCDGGPNPGADCLDDLDCRDDINGAGDCVNQYPGEVETFAGELMTFVMVIENVGPSEIPLVCITDTLECLDWREGPFRAELWRTDGGKEDVSGWLPGLTFDGTRHCFELPEPLQGLPAYPSPLPHGDRIVITFDVRVPPASTFSVPTGDPDCTNCDVVVEGYTDAGADTDEPADCDHEAGCPEIDVLIPDIACEKEVCAEDASGDTFGGCTQHLVLPRENVDFPLTLTYVFTVDNPASNSEVPLKNVTICDPELVQDALAAGLTIGSCDLCTGPCDGVDDTCVSLSDLNVGDSAAATCEIIVPAYHDPGWEWEIFADLDGVEDKWCYDDTAAASAEPDVAEDVCGEHPLEADCDAHVCIPPPTECTCTKAKFTVWNQNETKFSGTHRCICDWDETKLSDYDPPNHMLVQYLQTDKGKARIEGMASSVVCGPDSIDVPLLGVAAKQLHFDDTRDILVTAGSPLTGIGVEEGWIKYLPSSPSPVRSVTDLHTVRRPPVSGTNPPSSPPMSPAVVPPDMASPPREFAPDDPPGLASLNPQVGSLLVYPKIELKWDATGSLIQDVYVTLANHEEARDVWIKMYYVVTCDMWVDNAFMMTGSEPTYWSAATGLPRGLAPFTELIAYSEPDPDPRNAGGSLLRGYLLIWAIDVGSGAEIHWNYLSGTALTLNFAEASAWEYLPWTFEAVVDLPDGDPLPTPGELDLDGVEYDAAPAQLLLDFYASGASIGTASGRTFTVDTDLTLWPARKDLTD